jgi:hypothetical protein
MYPPPAIRTSQAELLGTTAGIIATFIVATLGLAVMIGMVYWASAHPGYKRPAPQPRPPQETAGSALTGNQRFPLQPSNPDQVDGSAGGAAQTGQTGAATKSAVHQRERT